MIKVANIAVILSLPLSFAGCATFQKGPTGQASISAEAEALNAPASWVFGTQKDGQIASQWTDVLSDPILDELIETALRNNPSLRASAENVARSEALLNQSRSNLLPSINADISSGIGGRLENGALSDSYSAGLSASWEADIWGGIRSGILASGYDLAGTKAAYESARQALIAAVARAYILSVESDLQTALSQQTLQAQEETLRIVNVRYELGAASRRELVLAESDVAGARDNFVVAKAQKTSATLALETLLGQYPNGDQAVSPDFPKYNQALGTGTPNDLLRRRPDVIAAELDVLSAFEATRAVQADIWPSLSLSGGINTASGNLIDIIDPVNIAYSLGARLADTLFDGGFSEARVEAATATQQQILANYGQTVLDAYFEVESTLNTIDILQERRLFVRQGADAARETLELSEIQYKEGAIDLIDVLTFRQRSFQADQTDISLRRQQIEARIALYLALGGTGFEITETE